MWPPPQARLLSFLPGNEACAIGKQQTPINLVAGVTKPQDLPNLLFAYNPSRLSMTNNGHTVQMTYDAGSTLSRTGSTSTSTLAQFHFHAPSEHAVEGASFPMELHLVHLDAAGKPAVVVGVFIKAGTEHAGLAGAFQGLPARSGDKSAPSGGMIDARALLPADKTFFTYSGSLTTPPCTEGLTWYVLKTPSRCRRHRFAHSRRWSILRTRTGLFRVLVGASCSSTRRRASRRGRSCLYEFWARRLATVAGAR